jgi:hypothetical protein
VVISYRLFGTTYRSHLQGSRIQMDTLRSTSDVLRNISFKEHLPEEGHNRWPKHVGG